MKILFLFLAIGIVGVASISSFIYGKYAGESMAGGKRSECVETEDKGKIISQNENQDEAAAFGFVRERVGKITELRQDAIVIESPKLSIDYGRFFRGESVETELLTFLIKTETRFYSPQKEEPVELNDFAVGNYIEAHGEFINPNDQKSRNATSISHLIISD